MYERKKKKNNGRFILTDELLDELANEFVALKERQETNLNFVQWLEWKTMRYL